MPRGERKWRPAYARLNFAALIALALNFLLFSTGGGGTPWWNLLLIIAYGAWTIGLTIDVALGRDRLSHIILTLLYNVLYILIGFSYLYWAYGAPPYFNLRLTHLDAFYFAVGTLGTGTGNIVATGEATRALQTLQMLLDLALLGFVFSLVLSRFSLRKPQAAEPVKPLETADSRHATQASDASPQAEDSANMQS